MTGAAVSPGHPASVDTLFPLCYNAPEGGDIMDTRAIRCFQQVYEKKSIHQAARGLFLTPQGVSRIIGVLEGELGARLFVRTPRGMEPTLEGRYFYEHSRPFTAQLLNLQLGIQEMKRQQQGLRVGLACGVLHVISVERLQETAARYPEFHLEWVEDFNENILKLLQEGTLSCGFCVGPGAPDGFFRQELFRAPVCAILYPGHPLYGAESLSVEDLKEEPLLCLNEHFSIYHNLAERCGDFGFTPHFAVKTMESSLIRRFCREGRGVGIDAAIHPEEPPLRQIPLREAAPWQVALVCPQGREKEPLLQAILGSFACEG